MTKYDDFKLPLSESFYSLQGEGPTTGYPAVFLRLAGCNLMCGGLGTQFDGELHNGATWRCDTLEVWMKATMKHFDDCLDDESKEALRNGANLIITGGEPTMQDGKIQHFIDYVREVYNPDCYVEIETNGTITPTEGLRERVNQFNVSPKLANSGNEKASRWKPSTIKELNEHPGSVFKFVLTEEKDFAEIQELYLDIIDRDKVWIMPSGENQELLNQSKQNVAELCKKQGLKMTTRLHIEIWDKKTGV